MLTIVKTIQIPVGFYRGNLESCILEELFGIKTLNISDADAVGFKSLIRTVVEDL